MKPQRPGSSPQRTRPQCRTPSRIRRRVRWSTTKRAETSSRVTTVRPALREAPRCTVASLMAQSESRTKGIVAVAPERGPLGWSTATTPAGTAQPRWSARAAPEPDCAVGDFSGSGRICPGAGGSPYWAEGWSSDSAWVTARAPTPVPVVSPCVISAHALDEETSPPGLWPRRSSLARLRKVVLEAQRRPPHRAFRQLPPVGFGP